MKPMSPRPAVRAFLASFATVLVVASCGGGVGPGSNLVGGNCTSGAQCQGQCVRSGSWPNGLCTVQCFSDMNCPGGSVCVNTNGGICAPACTVNQDCLRYNAGYICDALDRRPGPGATLACRVP